MFDLKPYGAFIENTVRPLLERLEETGIKLDKDNLMPMIQKAGMFHLWVTLIQSVTQFILMALVCYTILRIQWTT